MSAKRSSSAVNSKLITPFKYLLLDLRDSSNDSDNCIVLIKNKKKVHMYFSDNSLKLPTKQLE